jgi:hypothetical protein
MGNACWPWHNTKACSWTLPFTRRCVGPARAWPQSGGGRSSVPAGWRFGAALPSIPAPLRHPAPGRACRSSQVRRRMLLTKLARPMLIVALAMPMVHMNSLILACCSANTCSMAAGLHSV